MCTALQLGGDVEQPWLMSKMTSSIKPDVHNVSLRRQRRTEPWSYVTCTKNLVKIGRVVLKMWSRTGTLITVGSRVKARLVAVKTMLAHTTVPPVIVMCLLIVHSSWSRFLAVRLQVTWVINPTVGCHYFPPGLQLPLQPLRLCYQFRCLANRGTMGANSLPKTVTRQRHSGDLNSRPAVPESSTLTTRLPSHLWL